MLSTQCNKHAPTLQQEEPLYSRKLAGTLAIVGLCIVTVLIA